MVNNGRMIAIVVLGLSIGMIIGAVNWRIKKKIRQANVSTEAANAPIREYNRMVKVRQQSEEKEAGLKDELTVKDESIEGLQREISDLNRQVASMKGQITTLKKERDSGIAAINESLSVIEMDKQKELRKLEDKIEIDNWETNVERRRLKKELEDLSKVQATAIPILIEALDHPDMRLRGRIAKTLADVTGRPFDDDQGKWRQWWVQHRTDYIIEE